MPAASEEKLVLLAGELQFSHRCCAMSKSPGCRLGQNASDPLYKAMARNFDTSMAYQAARDRVFKGLAQPSGTTEPLLHAWRLKVKAAVA